LTVARYLLAESYRSDARYVELAITIEITDSDHKSD
jgi:hypothetical protein